MSYAFYKIIHVVSIVFFFAMYMLATTKNKDNVKKEIITTGVALLFIIVSGMGLVARLGYMHGDSWPLWVKLKIGIWLIIGMSAHIVLKRFTNFSRKYFWIAFCLLLVASYLANYKIG